MQILTVDDGTFPALLKTLSDPSDAVVTRDLLLLSQISLNSDDTYFTSFMVNLLKLFCTDRRLLETRGNLIIRQLCLTLSAERIYRTMADCLAKDEDVEFASIMVQNLNNNLITAPELADLRRRLRNLDNRVRQPSRLCKNWLMQTGRTILFCYIIQSLVPQRRRDLLTLPFSSSIRASIPFTSSLVSCLREVLQRAELTLPAPILK